MKIKPTRRLFLKGVGGYMLSLPILECMLNNNGDAYAQGGAIPMNYLYTYQGESSGHPRNNTMLWQPPQYGSLRNAYNSNPNAYGNQGFKEIARRNLLDDINVISNLYIRSNEGGGAGNIEVKGNSHPQSPIIHRSATYVVNSGYSIPSEVNMWLHMRQGSKHSTDQRLYDAIGKEGKHINFAVEKYQDGWAQSTSMRSGYIQTPEKDVGKAFDYIFGGFTPPPGGGTVDEGIATRRSILNLVLEDHKRLQKRLGYNDRLIVDQHLTSIRDLEESIAKMETQEQLSCEIPNRLSENTPINSRNYGGEKERAILFNRIIALAFACGITRVGQYCILRHKAYVDPTDYISSSWASKIAGNRKLDDLHEVGHNGTQDGLDVWKEMCWWIGDIYGDLVQRFKNTQVGSGTLLDHSFVMMGMLQGIGRSLENSSTNHVHSYENMCYLQAGGKAFGAQTGRHINGNRKHPVAISNAAVEMGGVNITFGEIKDKVDIS